MIEDPSAHTIFVVDDDAAVLKSLARVLQADCWRVRTFASAEAFLEDPNRHSGACLVLDVNLPGLDGLALQRQLSDAQVHLPIVFLTGHGDIPMSVRAIKAGAADFLTKPVQRTALNAAITEAIERDARERERHNKVEALQQRLASLSAREREVLALVAEGRLNKQIAAQLGIVEQTVKFHRTRIMERMNAKTVAELMKILAIAESD